jgi:hypothetical protein
MTTARSHFYRLAPLGILVLVGLVVYLNQARQPQGGPPPVLHCPDLAAGCSTRLDGRSVSVGVEGPLKVLQPFQVWVRAQDARRVQASFTMEGMDMGFNLYTLHADKEGVFRGRVTLPVCVSGRRDWVMTLDIDGRRLAIPFVTEL